MTRAEQILQDKTGSRSSIDVCTKYSALEAMKQIAWEDRLECMRHVKNVKERGYGLTPTEMERIMNHFEQWYTKQIEP